MEIIFCLIFKQGRAEFDALSASIHSQPSEHHDRHWIMAYYVG